MLHSQPQTGPLEIDRGNPLARDLVLVHSLGATLGQNAVTGLNANVTGTRAVTTERGSVSGFGATQGKANTDLVTTSLRNHGPGPRTYYVISKRVGGGGNGLGRLFGVAGYLDFYQNNSSLTFQAITTGASPIFQLNASTAAVWRSIAIAYDSTSGTNAPRIYVNGGNGANMGVATAGSGTGIISTNPFLIGNANTQNRVFDGQIQLVCVWDRILSTQEINDLDRNPWQLFLDHDEQDEDALMMRATAAPDAGVSAAAAVDLAALTASSAGSSAVACGQAITLGLVTQSSAGAAKVAGTSTRTLGQLTPGALAAVQAAGSSVATMAQLTQLATGTAAQAGASGGSQNVQLATMTPVAAGAATVTGSSAATLGAIQQTASGQTAVAGAGAVFLGQMTATTTGTASVQPAGRSAALVVNLGALTCAGVGAVRAAASAGGQLGALQTDARGAIQVVAWMNTTLAGLQVQASGGRVLLTRSALRTYLVPAENRTHVVPTENRTVVVE